MPARERASASEGGMDGRTTCPSTPTRPEVVDGNEEREETEERVTLRGKWDKKAGERRTTEEKHGGAEKGTKGNRNGPEEQKTVEVRKRRREQ